nr:hypothetical protein [Anaerolineae bacterium]
MTFSGSGVGVGVSVGVGVKAGVGVEVGGGVAIGAGVRVGVGVASTGSLPQPLSMLETITTAANPAVIHAHAYSHLLCSVWPILVHLRVGLPQRSVL